MDPDHLPSVKLGAPPPAAFTAAELKAGAFTAAELKAVEDLQQQN